jgi:hypothetical protein
MQIVDSAILVFYKTESISYVLYKTYILQEIFNRFKDLGLFSALWDDRIVM